MCHFCNEDIVMKSWVVGMNQTRQKLRSLNLHLTNKHEVATGQEREGDAFGGQPLLEGARVPGTFSGTVFCQHWRLPFYRCLLCLLCQEVSFRKRAFIAFKPYQLKQLVRIHTKEKPYNCEISQCKFRL